MSSSLSGLRRARVEQVGDRDLVSECHQRCVRPVLQCRAVLDQVQPPAGALPLAPQLRGSCGQIVGTRSWNDSVASTRASSCWSCTRAAPAPCPAARRRPAPPTRGRPVAGVRAPRNGRGRDRPRAVGPRDVLLACRCTCCFAGARDWVKAYASSWHNLGLLEDYATHAAACQRRG